MKYLKGKSLSDWLHSQHHRENIEGRFDVTGVGIARSRDGTYFFTQLFVARRRFKSDKRGCIGNPAPHPGTPYLNPWSLVLAIDRTTNNPILSEYTHRIIFG